MGQAWQPQAPGTQAGIPESLSPDLLYMIQRQPSCEIWESCGHS